jgi:hypothetical protein
MKRYSGPKETVDAAKNLSTLPDELAILSSSEFVFVREAVASNPHTPAHILDALVPCHLKEEHDFRIACSLLRNPHLPPQACVALISRISEILKFIQPRDYYQTMMIEQLCVNEDIPLESLSDLLNDDSFPKHLRGRIARKETRKEVLLILQQDKSESVRKKVTKVLESK